MISTRLKRLKWVIVFAVLVLFILANVVAYFHAYKFTHFDSNEVVKTSNPEELPFLQKIITLTFGIRNPKPANSQIPTMPFETIYLKSNTLIECWEIKTDRAKGTVIIYHGYSGEKSSMLDKAYEFLALNYNVMLVDLMGSGGSEGNRTTIGFMEARDVKASVNYLQEKGEKNIVLFGTSMGAVSIMKALNDYNLSISRIIIECPFGTMQQTVKSRFAEMGVPRFPMVHLLMFWGGVQNGFNTYNHNPIDYALNIYCPTLVLYGEKDTKVSMKEIEGIYRNLQGEKTLKTYMNAGHENYLIRHKVDWVADIEMFLGENEE